MTQQDLYDPVLRNELAKKLAMFHSIEAPTEKKNEFLERFLTKGVVFVNDMDLKSEYEWITDQIRAYDSPIVFAHNDFRVGNVLITEDNGLLLSDFDYSTYGRRGLDFGSLFHGFTDQLIVEELIASYVEECKQIKGKDYSSDSRNCVQYMTDETKLFSMTYQLFVIKGLKEFENSFVTKDKKQVYKCYIECHFIRRFIRIRFQYSIE